MLSSLSDETPEGRSIVALARERYGFQPVEDASITFIPFSAMTRMSGVDVNGGRHPMARLCPAHDRKGATDSIATYVAKPRRSDERGTLRSGTDDAELAARRWSWQKHSRSQWPKQDRRVCWE